MADNDQSNLQEMMANLARLEETAKNMENLVAERKKERQQLEAENERIHRKLQDMKEQMDAEDEEVE